MARQWILTGQKGFDKSLQYHTNVPVPAASELKPNEVLVKIHAASINYRDLDIASSNPLNGPIAPPLVPDCDGAGVVEAVGSAVSVFKPGDRVVTHVWDTPDDDAHPSIYDSRTMLGMGTDGTLRSMGVFSENCLVHAPSSLNWLQASTLTVTWVTAWNVLFGLEGITAGPGKQILVQGTGGVAIAALQLGVAVGADVIATTSTPEKEARLKALGAKHTVRYRDNPNWAADARALTPNGKGFDIVIEVGGNETLAQSLTAVRVGGLVTIVGGVGAATEPVPLFAAFMASCVVRGIINGSKRQYKELVRFIDEKKIKPIIDDEVFELAEAKEAYRRVSEKKHFSKVVIRVDH